MTCKCGKTLVARTIATKTKKYGKDIVVLESVQALVCDDCGVAAYGQMPRPVEVKPVPYRPLWPLPAIGQPLPSPFPASPWRPSYPQTTC